MLDDLRKQIASLTLSLDSVRTDSRSLQRQLQESEKENAVLSHRLKDAESQTDRFLREKFASTKRLEELQESLDQVRKRTASEQAAHQFAEERKAFVQKLEELQQQVERFGDDLWQSRQLATALEERLRQVQHENADVKSAFEKAAEQASRYQSLRDEAVMATQQLQQSQMELEQQIESIQGSAEKSVRASTGKLLETRQQLLDLQSAFDSQAREFDDWKRSQQAKSQKRKAKEKEKRKTEAKVETKLRKKIEELETQLKEAKSIEPIAGGSEGKQAKKADADMKSKKRDAVASHDASALSSARRSNERTKKQHGKKAASKAASKAGAQSPTSEANQGDDLKRIEGIGPKTEAVLKQSGVDSFIKLAKMKEKRLKEILREAGPRFSIHNPRTWPRQARLAAKGKWEELRKLQDDLVAGRA